MFGPLGVRDGALTFTSNAVFTPNGLVARGETFRWEDVGGRPLYAAVERWPGIPSAGWAFELVIQDQWAMTVRLAVGVHTGGPPHYDEPVTSVRLGGALSAVSAVPAVTAYALASYLRDEPRARPGLGDPAKVDALYRALGTLPRWRSDMPREPLMGDAHDVHWAAIRAFRHLVPRRYDDRRVDADPAPSIEALLDAARLELRTGLRDRVTDATLVEHAEPLLRRVPWPFGLLL